MFIKIMLLMCSVLMEALSEECITPNGEDAQCIPIHSCPMLLNSLAHLKSENIEFVKKSQCGYADYALVCCGSSPTYVTSTTPTSFSQDKLKLIPSRRFCGYQRYDDYIHTKNSSTTSFIDEFPWMATLTYATITDDIDDGIYCVGSLISKRYVLTTADCLTPYQNKVGSVRLGEYNKAENDDCVRNEQFDECTDPIEDYGVEEVIVHENFRKQRSQYNIGLIRLNRTVIFTDYIRPICLPFPDGTKFAKLGDILVQSGWGKTDFSGKTSKTKKKILIRLLPNEDCDVVFKQLNVTEEFTCTVEVDKRSSISCYGDSGGPVMFSYKNQWHQEALSYAHFCGLLPSVNTRVSIYLDWILENITP